MNKARTVKRLFSISRFPQVRKLKVSLPLKEQTNHKAANDLKGLQHRVELTERNLYIHMGSVDTMLSCVEDCLSGKKVNNTIKRLERLRSKIQIKDVRSIRNKIDKAYGMGGNRKGKMSVVLLRPRRVIASRKGILKSLTKITGEMASFTDNISRTLNTFQIKQYP